MLDLYIDDRKTDRQIETTDASVFKIGDVKQSLEYYHSVNKRF